MWKRIVPDFKQPVFVKRWVEVSKVRSLPGFEGAPTYSILEMLVKEIFSPTLSVKANAIAYSFFLSFFPALIALISLIPYVLPKSKKADIADSVGLYLQNKEVQHVIKQIMPGTVADEVVDEIRYFLNNKRGGILSLGFLLAIYFSANGVMTLMTNFEKSYSVFKQMKFWEKRLRAIGITAVLGILMIGSFAFIILGTQLVNWVAQLVKLGFVAKALLFIIQWSGSILLFYFGIAIIYRFGIALNRKQTFFSVGATAATIFSMITSIGFSFYISHFSKNNALYGSIGGVIVLLGWLQLNAMILILGFELNAAIAVNRYFLTEEEEKSRKAPV